MIIRKVNALAGAGKTFAAVHYADRNARIGHKYALVQPTQDLIDETVKEIRKLKPTYSVTAIHGGTSDTVIRDIVDHIRTARSHEGDILLMTHAAFQRLPYWHHKDEWHVIVDEIFQADRAFDFNLSVTATDWLGSIGWCKPIGSNHRDVVLGFSGSFASTSRTIWL